MMPKLPRPIRCPANTTRPLAPPPFARHDFSVITVMAFVHGIRHLFQLVPPAPFPWLISAFGLDFTRVGLTMAGVETLQLAAVVVAPAAA